VTALYRTRAFFHFIGRLLYRLSRWGNCPLSEEQLRWAFKISKVQARKEVLQELPILKVQPAPLQPAESPERHTDPTTVLQHLPPGMLSRAVHDEMQVSGKLPRISGVLRSINLAQDKPAGPKRTVPLVPPVDHITTLPSLVSEPLAPEVRKLFHDMSWLNDKEGEIPHDPFPAKVPDDDVTLHRLPVVGKRLTVRFDPRA
jgi:hypothetical protein